MTVEPTWHLPQSPWELPCGAGRNSELRRFKMAPRPGGSHALQCNGRVSRACSAPQPCAWYDRPAGLCSAPVLVRLTYLFTYG